ncbi:hypothetical protein MMC31_007918, partial [Peltigera leucophlebia]|nr:hypothetical protein [Peltigera leucophlebia]
LSIQMLLILQLPLNHPHLLLKYSRPTPNHHKWTNQARQVRPLPKAEQENLALTLSRRSWHSLSAP